MPITSVQKTSIEEVLAVIVSATAPRGKRVLSTIFMDLVDRAEWPEYYELIPEPRCLNNIRTSIEKGRYKEALDVYTDLSLVFWNAIFYNEPNSQIASDAQTLKGVLETEWKKKSVLPIPRTSPPPSSAQKVHKTAVETSSSASPAPSTPAAVPVVTPAPLATVAPALHPDTPTPHTLAVPTAGGSNSNYTYSKPIPIRPRSAQHQPSPEVDVDIMSDADGDDVGGGEAMERDQESEEIVKQLEKGLPRWPGFGEKGWMDGVSQERLLEIVHVIKTHKDIIGNRLATALESIPEESTIPNLSYTFPLSLKLIEAQVRAKGYATSGDFDMAMARLFEKARRWHEPGTDAYGRVLLLQRFYQALTSPSPFPGPPYLSSTNFASLRAGPGNAKPVHGVDGEGVAGVTTHRVLTKDRTFVEEVHYKGWIVKLADWLHLSNPDDPSRPIIAQVFRCWVSDEPTRRGQPGLTVSWYYRPEQTFHPASRKFWEGEVFKTSHFADHSLEDIIEKIACQFTARHIRGRPRPPFWYVGFPLYVCDSRYNDRDRVFVKIKNWNSCVPEEVRQSTEFMPIYPFERTVFPSRFLSPFISRNGKAVVKGPGGLVPEALEQHREDGDKEEPARKRTRRNPGGDAGPSKGLFVGSSVPGTNAVAALSHYQYQPPNLAHQTQQPARGGIGDRSIITAVGGGSNAHVDKLPSETTKHFDRDPETNEVLWFPAPPMNMARAPAPKHSLAYLHFLATQRKRETSEDRMEVDEDSHSAKRRRIEHVPPTVTETLRAVLMAASIEGQ